MSYAEWYVTTIPTVTTGEGGLGSAGYWEELPDAFHPIIYINTTTPTLAENDGLYFEYCVTSPYFVIHFTTEGEKGTTYIHPCGCCNCVPLLVDEYITGSKRFRINTAVSDGGETRSCKKLKLYYRDQTEIGVIP